MSRTYWRTRNLGESLRVEVTMHRRRLVATGLVIALSFGLSSVARAQELSADAQRVVAYLVDQWAQQFRSTSIPLAMDNLDIDRRRN